MLESLDAAGLVLLVLPEPDATVEKSFRNLSHVRTIYAGNLGTHEILYADWVVFTRAAIEGVRA